MTSAARQLQEAWQSLARAAATASAAGAAPAAGASSDATLDDATLARLEQYLALLDKWNRHINLSGSREHDALVAHVADCLAVVPHLPSNAARALDVGSGAGLPGAIVAIVRPSLVVTAIEPVHKKHAFLATVARELQLPNFEPLPVRLEQLEVATGYDVVMSRATFALPTWLELARGAVRSGGLIIGMEGSEQHALPPQAQRYPYSLPAASGPARTRAIVVAK